MKQDRFDIVVAGAGFAGSIAALVLSKCGFKVCVIEKDRHPRFAIGESSTPVADLILRALAARYDLPFLRQLSRYGTWRQHFPHIQRGLKRGFSYYWHFEGEEFVSDEDYSNELLVAASPDDFNSDTHWYRADVDAFLAREVQAAGTAYFEQAAIASANRTKDSRLELDVAVGDRTRRFQCEWLIDATGSPRLAASLFNVDSISEGFETDSFALFSHFAGVKPWRSRLEELGCNRPDYPYDPDHSALHHLTPHGWMWNLRFDNHLLSAGFGVDSNHPSAPSLRSLSLETAWRQLLSVCPSIRHCFDTAELAAAPGRLIRTARLQRRLARLHGPNWIALNHTAGFIDPMHSTGIAHTLCGIERLLSVFHESWNDRAELTRQIEAHEAICFAELRLIDQLVALCYRSRTQPDLFHACAMIYFACSLAYEQTRLAGAIPESFLNATDNTVQAIVRDTSDDLNRLLSRPPTARAVAAFMATVRDRIDPGRRSGLLDPERRNLYRHTAVRLD